jgi:hypothetical protein
MKHNLKSMQHSCKAIMFLYYTIVMQRRMYEFRMKIKLSKGISFLDFWYK